ncbi:MAG: hypothetical protein COA44_11270 [Arcobacter sp.]|nr:MAG: hypothetical protein COA44_11270 [Arcobacter sp.]
MEIGFAKVGTPAIAFEISKGNLKFSGTLRKFSRYLIELEAKITGDLDVPCDVCAEAFTHAVNESVKFHLSDGLSKVENESLEDIVEIEDSMIDLKELFESELELYKSNYFTCSECKNSD